VPYSNPRNVTEKAALQLDLLRGRAPAGVIRSGFPIRVATCSRLRNVVSVIVERRLGDGWEGSWRSAAGLRPLCSSARCGHGRGARKPPWRHVCTQALSVGGRRHWWGAPWLRLVRCC
jgi:hypothetical protein